MRAILWVFFLLLLSFTLGYGPAKLESHRIETQLRSVELDLRLSDLHRQIGVASEEAQRNNFANAATAASAFFDGCGSVLASYPLEDRQRTRIALSAYAGQREVIMGQLAVADPQVKEELSSLYLTMNGVLERRQ